MQEHFVFPSAVLKTPHQVLPQPSPVTTVPAAVVAPLSNQNYYVFDNSPQLPLTQYNAHEMQEVDDLVRARAENLPDWTDDDEDDSSQSASSSVAGFSPRSESSSSSYFNDDDNGSDTSSPSSGKSSSAPKRRSRPYGRSVEDKKSRKKEQNKNAATRYRQKKKAEIEVALDEERELLDINHELEVKYADVQREIKYLKNLMRDLYRAKGLL